MAKKSPRDYSKLDQRRPYGEVHPPGRNHFFDQDGFPYDHEGKLVETLLSDEQKKQIDEAQKRMAAERAAQKARRAALAKAGLTDDDDEDDDDFDDGDGGRSDPGKKSKPQRGVRGEAPSSDPERDALIAWAQKKETAPFDQIQTTLRERYGIVVATSLQATQKIFEQFGIDPEADATKSAA